MTAEDIAKIKAAEENVKMKMIAKCNLPANVLSIEELEAIISARRFLGI